MSDTGAIGDLHFFFITKDDFLFVCLFVRSFVRLFVCLLVFAFLLLLFLLKEKFDQFLQFTKPTHKLPSVLAIRYTDYRSGVVCKNP